MEEKPPVGVIVLGGLNCFVLGGLFFLIGLWNILRITPQEFQTLLEVLKERGIPNEITYRQFKKLHMFSIIVSLVWGVAGAGVLLRRDWGRKTTLYFALFVTGIIFLAVLMQPSFLRRVAFQLLYLGILILYFTQKSIEKYFTDKRRKE